MITLISFFIVLLGTFNWLSIGLMQYDFVAGIFGTQSSFLSRAVYIVVGFAGVWLVIMAFVQRGRIKINDNGFKRDVLKAKKRNSEQKAYVVEADREYTSHNHNELDYQTRNEQNYYREDSQPRDKSPFE